MKNNWLRGFFVASIVVSLCACANREIVRFSLAAVDDVPAITKATVMGPRPAQSPRVAPYTCRGGRFSGVFWYESFDKMFEDEFSQSPVEAMRDVAWDIDGQWQFSLWGGSSSICSALGYAPVDFRLKKTGTRE
jgi:hypothetical protein